MIQRLFGIIPGNAGPLALARHRCVQVLVSLAIDAENGSCAAACVRSCAGSSARPITAPGRGENVEVRCVWSEKAALTGKSLFFIALALKWLLSNVLSKLLSSSCLSASE